MNEKSRLVGFDVFSGVGGMSLGFEQAGFNVDFAIDYDPIHTKTYSKNFPKCRTVCIDVSELSVDEILDHTLIGDQNIDVLFGGPPCEGFSLIGKRNSNDPRNLLLPKFARLIQVIAPSYFVVENVQGILIGNARITVCEFLKIVRQAGYSVVLPIKTLDACNFGVPQKRSRVFILGYRQGLKAPKYPYPTTPTEEKCQQPTVWDAIGDLPRLSNLDELLKSDVYRGKLGTPSEYAKLMRGELLDSDDLSETAGRRAENLSGCSRTRHSDDTIRRFISTVPGTYEKVSRYYRLTKNGLAPTLRSGSDKDHGSYTAPRPIHPIEPRCITVREAARLHSFPDWFQFNPTKWHGFRQVGNSVPPLLARAIAKEVALAMANME